MDDLNLDEIEKDINNKNTVEERVRNLHAGKKEAETKFEAESKARQEAEAKIATLEKESTFLNSFSDSIAKYPTATQFKDEIKNKVMSGYSVEDATVAILHSKGQLGTAQSVAQTIERVENSMGGSAPTQLANNAPKSAGQMTQAERLEGLREAEKRGDLFLS